MPYRKLDNPLEEDALRRLYVDEKMSLRQIGRELGVSENTIAYNMEKFGIRKRNKSEAMAAQVYHGRTFNTNASGKNHPWWKGGRTAKLGGGYLGIRIPDHPKAGKNGYVFEHVLVWESVNGPVPKGSHIHHRDGDKHNNKIENLEVLTPKAHALVIPELRERIFRLEERVAELETEVKQLRGKADN